MKKIFIFVLIFILSVTLISCGGSSDTTDTTDTEAVTEEQSVNDTETEPETETEPATETEAEPVTETETETEAVTETETEAETEPETEAETETEAVTEAETKAETEAEASGEPDPNTWLCKAGGPFPTGWWMGTVIDPNVPNWNIDVDFITPNAFDGFVMACYAGAEPPALLKVSLLDLNGNLLEAVDVEIVGDHENDAHGFTQVYFSKAYAKGAYTICFEFVEGSYFVLGCADASDIDVSVSGNAASNETTLAAPAIALYGAVPPAK